MTGNAPSASIHDRLRGKTGRGFWRSLDELSGSAEFATWLEAEFPALAPLRVDRRAVLKGMAASLALAGLTGCKWEAPEKALPYVNAPPGVTPGVAQHYATAVTLAGYALPCIGKTYVGRPVKLEGNPDHPASGGASDAFLQASLLGLYDPDRSQAPRYLGRSATWQAYDSTVTAKAAELDAAGGEGLRLLTGAVTSPTLLRQIASLQRRWPKFRWHIDEPLDRGSRRDAAVLAFGRKLDWHLHLDRAHTVVALDDDVLGPGPHQTLHARRWSARRQAYRRGDGGSRLFVAEPTLSLTGAAAERRLIAAPWRIAPILRAVAARLGLGQTAGELPAGEAAFVATVVAAIEAAIDTGRQNALVTVGAQHAPELQALALRLNRHLGTRAIGFTDPVASLPSGSLPDLLRDIDDGAVTTLLMLEVNPAYAAPGALRVADVLDKVPLRLHAGLHFDETAALSHWHAPLSHALESWSDARAVDGTASLIQPLVQPLYATRTGHDLLAGWLGDNATGRALVQATWRDIWRKSGHGDFDARWRQALAAGLVADSAPQETVEPQPAGNDIAIPDAAVPPAGFTALFRADATVWDGRFANNAWLQELPKPFSKIVWDNVVLVAPEDAWRLGIANGDELRLRADDRSLLAPAWIAPGQAPRTIVLSPGYGRRRGGRVAQGLGYDAYALQHPDRPWMLDGIVIARTGKRRKIASTQLHQAMDGFDFVRVVDGPDAAAPASAQARHPQTSFYPERHWDSPSWGMSIDLDACIGCNACAIACMAENNVPVVGKDLVAQGREMHWLRIDHYFEGDVAAPRSHFQPVPCMHCEQAPCEMGCPVNAAVHSKDGLNLQVYNRCIGTRTCSSFCPYKVRHFNWFDYTSDDSESLRAMRNPEVTVRSRGVMEKCTYCIQRISAARIAAKKEDRPIRDGEVVTACQQACPTQAIAFGDITDPASAVSRHKARPRNYTLLEEANTRPRTTYLAKIAPAGDTGGGTGGSG